MSGLTETGFEIDTIDEIVDAISQSMKDSIDARVDTTATSVFGQMIGIVAERERKALELARDVWAAFTPSGASGVSLSQLTLITGTKKRDKTKSEVTATLSLNAGITVPAGSTVAVVGVPGNVFETIADVTNPGGSPADIDAVLRATVAGPVRANSGTLTVIVSPVSGWTAVTNASDATLGREVEKDQDLRERRETEIRQAGSATIDAITADVSVIPGVVDSVGSENNTEATVDGIPAHSFRITVWDGDPSEADSDAIAQAIWDAKPAGIVGVGDQIATAVDAKGNNRTVYFSRANSVKPYFGVDLTTNSAYPVDGDDQVIQAMADYALAHWKIGDDVIPSALYASIFAVSGVVSIDAMRLGLSPSPVGTAILVIADTDIALLDTGRVVVNS